MPYILTLPPQKVFSSSPDGLVTDGVQVVVPFPSEAIYHSNPSAATHPMHLSVDYPSRNQQVDMVVDQMLRIVRHAHFRRPSLNTLSSEQDLANQFHVSLHLSPIPWMTLSPLFLPYSIAIVYAPSRRLLVPWVLRSVGDSCSAPGAASARGISRRRRG